ncbi:MAG: DUF4968 domain-containing protein [Spirochaetaceae bacterium]|nr:DUF4968 domain-containing protein [Spirochaetaceae bacterium]
MNVSYRKLAAWILKYRIRYPRFRNKCMDMSEPNLVNGLTDHPLDEKGSPAYEIFTIVRKFLARKPISVLVVELKQRDGNSFVFRAKGFDILRDRDLSLSHVGYLTGDTVKCTECALRLDILNSTAFRLRLSMGEKVPPHDTPMVSGSIEDENLSVDFAEHADSYIISTPELSLHISKENFRIGIYDKSGSLVTESGSRTHNEFPNATDAFPMGFVRNRKPKRLYAVENFNLQPGESIYGLGEKFGPMNRTGQTISLWNQDGLGNTTGRAYKHIPFYLSSQGYGVFFNDSSPMTFWVGTKETSKIQVAIRNDLLDYYFFYGPEPKKVLGSYTALTGRAVIPPRWSFGLWVSRLSYSSQDEVIAVAKRLREERYPSDVINIDTNWSTQEWVCDWRFDKDRFPDPERMFRECRELGFKICLWQLPYVVDTLAAQKEGKKRKAFAKNHGRSYSCSLVPRMPSIFQRKKALRGTRRS